MALPRMNNFSFWILPFAFTLLILSLFVPGGAPAWRLDAVSAAGAAGRRRASRCAIFAIHLHGRLVDHGRDQRHRDDHEHARAGRDAAQHAAVRAGRWLITAYLLIAVMPVLAGAVTMLLTDHFFGTSFFCGCGRRRSGDVPAHLLVLRAPRGLHHDPAGVRHRLGDHPDVLAQAAVRLRRDGVRDGVDRVPVVHRLGAPHVHGGHAARRASCSSCCRRC